MKRCVVGLTNVGDFNKNAGRGDVGGENRVCESGDSGPGVAALTS